MRSTIAALPKISFDLGGVFTLNESFATGGTIFSQGDIAKTLMYIQKGRVKLSVNRVMGRTTVSGEEPGKHQKLRSCRAQELAQAVPRKMRSRKRAAY